MPVGGTTGPVASVEQKSISRIGKETPKFLSESTKSSDRLIREDRRSLISTIDETRQRETPCACPYRNEKCLITIPSTSSSATWNGETVDCCRLTPNSLLPLMTATLRSGLLPKA